jgi:hypothetical protein
MEFISNVSETLSADIIMVDVTYDGSPDVGGRYNLRNIRYELHADSLRRSSKYCIYVDYK